MKKYFRYRFHQPELLDNPNIPAVDIEKNMQELGIINKYLGGHRITINGFKHFVKSKKSISICEIGCGGGDNLKAIAAYATKYNIAVSLTGIDYNEYCIRYAKTNQQFTCNWIVSDYAKDTTQHDIIFCSLFTHHFSNDELVKLILHMKTNSKLGFFINDLHRHPLAYYSIKILTALFSNSYLVKNDAPLSVLNGFTKKEWYQIFALAKTKFNIAWYWAFRHLIIYNHAT
jgi:2-polyprenyl-3-methyl-5-hydroxy-6-metoxy-1,4-benzoquinol methylase